MARVATGQGAIIVEQRRRRTPTFSTWFRVFLILIFLLGCGFIIASYNSGSTWNFMVDQVLSWTTRVYNQAMWSANSYACAGPYGSVTTLTSGFVWRFRFILVCIAAYLAVVMIPTSFAYGIFRAMKGQWQMADQEIGEVVTVLIISETILIVLITMLAYIQHLQCPPA